MSRLVAVWKRIDEPQKTEAIRVCRGRIFIGVMNCYSMIGIQGLLTKRSPVMKALAK